MSQTGTKFAGWGSPATLPLLGSTATSFLRQSGLNPLHSGTRHYRRANWSMDLFAETVPNQGRYGDFDGDGVSNCGELVNETAVASPDTGGDGLIDGESMTMSIYNPLFTAWIGKGIPYENKDDFSCQTSQTRDLPLKQ